jgi:ADP-heptose:LPS heptosyltransferase
MYGVFRPFWRRAMPDLYTEMTTPTRLTAPPALEGLPASYVAAKFYASEACANTPSNHRMVNDIVRAVANTTDVVLLHSGARYDDHGEFTIEAHPRVHRVQMDPATNLETQTAIISHASSFIGTYGGFAYLAAFLGVTARTFYARPNFRRDHRQVMDRLCETVLQTSFTVDLLATGAARGHRHAA